MKKKKRDDVRDWKEKKENDESTEPLYFFLRCLLAPLSFFFALFLTAKEDLRGPRLRPWLPCSFLFVLSLGQKEKREEKNDNLFF